MAGDSADDGRSSCGGLGSDIWYSYFPSFTGNLKISICNSSDYDPGWRCMSAASTACRSTCLAVMPARVRGSAPT